ncbi:MAG: SpoIIE family protein phosphatase [candidate division KSB1 bacterium]|nr:SpoIIE family protein phosphatase [candidate division KSB1 bacterium]MDZ7365764.1 SpoIIE family protein phosphatase [candidate division KSB1 bacterium]MDZ7403757.1 SpoIIE family protein phosphatase [candidate division KSB1 bacterium]
MENKSMSRRLLVAVFAIIGLAIGAYLMPQVNPYFASRPELARGEARRIVDACLKQQGFDVSGFFNEAIFVYDHSGLDYLMGTFGVKPVIDLGRDDRLPLSYWQFTFYRNVPKDQQQEIFRVRVSPSGKLIGFIHILPDSVAGDTLSAAAALQLAQRTLQNWPDIQFDDFKLEESSSTQKMKRTDHKLVFARTNAALGAGAEVLEVQIAGTELASVMRYFRDPQDFVSASGVVGPASLLINAISVAVYVVLLFVSLVMFLRKYHEGEIGVRTGLWLGGILFFTLLLYTINIWDRIGYGAGFGPISPLYTKLVAAAMQVFFGYNFMALMVLGAWTVGEQFLRLDRPKLLAGVDSVFNRRWITQNIGRELPVGLAWGLMIFGAIQLVIYLIIHHLGALPRLSYNSFSAFEGHLPWLGILVSLLVTALFDELVFRLFLISSLRRLLKSTVLAIFLAGVLYGFFLVFFNETYSFRPAPFTLIPSILLGLAQGFVFWRYGLLASMASGGVFAALNQIGPLLGSAEPYFIGSGIAGSVLLLGLLVTGWIGSRRGERFDYKPETEPAHIRRIKERVRMQKELEIARRVQLHLLPKEQPKIAGFDIAGACLPALEVGGDYFDFVGMRDGKLGIAVGDVSGKGVPAAIYMTLTKGILQSHAEEDPSPKHVLSKVNHLMYRTIERNWYVSMFYAVLDSRRRLLRFARAGHNPAIVFSSGASETRLLQTAGIGLGLERGDIFTKTLVEGELQLSPGDTLVFYTDGFTEAMNRDLEEFGTDRFLDLLRRNDNGSAEHLVQRAFDEVRRFAGDHPQHDDMTIVVLKAY